VVSYPHFWMNYTGGWAHSRKALEPTFAALLLDHGVDPNARASLREEFHGAVRKHRGITPLAWGRVFHNPIVVNESALRLLSERVGRA
jgi:hypothetical protein